MASVAGPRPAGGVHPSGSVVRDPAVQPVRCPVTWVRRPGSGVRPSGVHRSGVQPVGVHPSVRTRPPGPPSGGGGWGQADAARQPPPRERGPGPCGLPRRRAARSTAEPPRTRATPPRRRRVGGLSVANPGRVGCGRRPRLTLASWAGQAGVPSARRRRLREGTARGRRARLPHRPGGCRPRDGWGDHPAWWSWRPPPALTGPEGADGLAGGDGRAAPARPRLAASVPGLLPTAL
jgi:hypothetical protein